MEIGELKRFVSVNPRILEAVFRSKEIELSGLRSPLIVRCDGVGFSKSLRGFSEPRDYKVHKALVNAAKKVMSRYGAELSLIISDEVSFLFSTIPFSGRAVKISSVISSILSAHVSLNLGRPLYFDGRPIRASWKEVPSYFIFRVRVGLNNYVSKKFHNFSLSLRRTPPLAIMISELARHGVFVNANEWELLGTLLRWDKVIKRSVNPISGLPVEVERRTIVEETPYLNNIVSAVSDIITAIERDETHQV